MKQYLKILTQTEVNEIIREVTQLWDLSRIVMYPEDICDLKTFSKRGLMPWQLYPAFADAGKSEFFKIRNYGNVRLAWTPERKALLWQRYWEDKVNDWDIAKEFKSTWQTIKRMRSRFHLEDNDPRWVKFIHTTRKGLSSTQEKLQHTDSDFVGAEKPFRKEVSDDDTVIDLRGSILTQENLEETVRRLEQGEFEENLKLLDYRESDKKLWEKIVSNNPELKGIPYDDDKKKEKIWSEKAIEADSEELIATKKKMGVDLNESPGWSEVKMTLEESDAMVAKMIKEQFDTTVFSDFVSFNGPIIGEGELKMISSCTYAPFEKAFKVLEKEYRELRKDFEVVGVLTSKPTLYNVIIQAAHEFLPKARIHDKDLKASLMHIDGLELVAMVQSSSHVHVIRIDQKQFIFTLSRIDPHHRIGFFFLAHVIDNSAK